MRISLSLKEQECLDIVEGYFKETGKYPRMIDIASRMNIQNSYISVLFRSLRKKGYISVVQKGGIMHKFNYAIIYEMNDIDLLKLVKKVCERSFPLVDAPTKKIINIIERELQTRKI